MSIIAIPSNNIQNRFMNRKMQLLSRLVKHYEVYVFDLQEPINFSSKRLIGSRNTEKLFDDKYLKRIHFYDNYKIRLNSFAMNELVNSLPNFIETYSIFNLRDIKLIINFGNMTVGWLTSKILGSLIKINNKNDGKILLDVDEYLPFHARSHLISYGFTRIIHNTARLMFDSLIKNNSVITAVSKPLLNYVKSVNHNSEVHIVSNGADTSLFKPTKDYLKDDILTLGYIGTFYDNHGLEMAIKALPLILSKIDCKLVYVGSGLGYFSLKKLAKQLGVEKQVKFVGPIPYEQVPKQINQMDVCINPVYRNLLSEMSSPRKIFEYFACERPVISTPLIEVKRIFGDLAYYAETPEEIAEQLINIVSNPAQAKYRARKARKLVLEQYSWEVLSTRFIEIINQLVRI